MYFLRLLCLLSLPFTSFGQHTTFKPVAIDFSFAGYKASIEPLPQVPSVLRVVSTGGDDTRLLQAAIDALSQMPVMENGYRGALELSGGIFRVAGQLKVNGSGIVVRGTSGGKQKTVLLATGTDRRALIAIGGKTPLTEPKRYEVSEPYVAAGSTGVVLQSTNGLSIQDRVLITRPSTKEWIAALGMDTAKGAFADMRTHWTPGSRNLQWHRIIKSIDHNTNRITFDAPITTALEAKFGGGFVQKESQMVQNIGIESLLLQSAYDKQHPIDEEHAWMGIHMDASEDVYVNNVQFRHFAGSAVIAGPHARRITIAHCQNMQPVSEVGGYRRHSFLVEGSQVLVYRCSSEKGINDFATGFCAPGPNVFLDCVARKALDASGSFESWASGVLYEEVSIDGAPLRISFDMERTQGSGWTAANSLLWNCTAKELTAKGFEGAANEVVSQAPALFAMQLKKRSNSSLDLLLASKTRPGSIAKAFTIKDIPAKPVISKAAAPLQIINGRFVIDGKTIWGGSVNDAWWMGQMSPAAALDAGISITRFVPGKTGPGHTENLSALADSMVQRHTPFYQSGPGLWYDRRRDDHTIVERMDNHVWAPFYELPWARSGKGKAWDGLSLYDLTRYNSWYFQRTKEFAQLSNQNGLVMYHSLYNTHNLLEIGAHWCDYPWRPANTISKTALPEPMPLEPNDRLHVANEFYNTDHPAQKSLHEAFIRKVLNELGAYNNLIFNVGFQFAGPLQFQEFFIREAAAWGKKNGRTLLLSLATSKDITDAVLNNPALEPHISVVDMRYWQYRPDGSLWAPPGGKNLAFREMITQEFKKSSDAAPATTPEQAYRQVREYRDCFPDKALVVWHNDVGPIPAFMAGAAQVLMQNPTAGHGQGRTIDHHPFDAFIREHLSAVAQTLSPLDGLLENEAQNWVLANANKQTLVLYSLTGEVIRLKEAVPHVTYTLTWYDPQKGSTLAGGSLSNLARADQIKKPGNAEWLLLMQATENIKP